MRSVLAPVVIALAALAALCSCAPARGGDVDDATARQVLEETVNLTEQGLTAEICAASLFPQECLELVLTVGGDDAVPDDPPEVACSFHVDEVAEVGGQVLVVAGRDGLDRRYVSDFLVHRREGRAVPLHGAYWTGEDIAPDRPANCPDPRRPNE